eukprot:g16818.t1
MLRTSGEFFKFSSRRGRGTSCRLRSRGVLVDLKLGGEGRPSGWLQRSPAAGAAQGSPSAAAAGSAAPAKEAGPGVAAAPPPPTTIAPGPPVVATNAEVVVPGWAQTLPPPWLSSFFPQNCPGRVLVPGDQHNLTLLIYHFQGLVLEEKQKELLRQAQVPAPVVAQAQSQADAAGGASATVPATPKPAPLTEQDIKDAEHWAENLAASTPIEDVAAGLEHLVKKLTVPEEYQRLCAKSSNQNKMKQICGFSSACEKPKGKPDADYVYDPVCLEKVLRVVFKDQIVAQGLGKEDSRCVPVPSDSGYIQTRPDLKNIGPLPDFLKSRAEFRSYFNKKAPRSIPPT